jgi:hypothetical protein
MGTYVQGAIFFTSQTFVLPPNCFSVDVFRTHTLCMTVSFRNHKVSKGVSSLSAQEMH